MCLYFQSLQALHIWSIQIGKQLPRRPCAANNDELGRSFFGFLRGADQRQLFTPAAVNQSNRAVF